MESESAYRTKPKDSAGGAGAIIADGELERLYCLYREEILRFLKRTFGSGPPDPEDVVQVVFERYAAAGGGEEVHNARAFLFRSARNFVIDERRRQSVRSEYIAAAQATADQSDDLDAERVLDSQQRWAAIEAAIEKLDVRSREMLLMNRIHGFSCAEIARRRGCSATLVKSIIARALVACHRALGDND